MTYPQRRSSVASSFRTVGRRLGEQIGDVAYVAIAHIRQLTEPAAAPPERRELARRAAALRVQIRRDTVAERRVWRAWLAQQRLEARRDLAQIVLRAELDCDLADWTEAR